MRFVPPPSARVTGSPFAPMTAPAPEPVVKLPVAVSDPDAHTAPLTEVDLLEAEELELDPVPAWKPKKNRWALVAVGALTALSATYLLVRHLDSTESRNPASHVVRAEAPSHVVTLPVVDPEPTVAEPVQVTPVQPSAVEVRPVKPVEPAPTVQPRKPAPAPRKPAKPVRAEDPDVGF